MAGTYRKIMHKPTLMQHRVFRYDNLNEPLALSDEDVALGRSLTAVNPAGRHAALQFDIQLGTSSCESSEHGTRIGY